MVTHTGRSKVASGKAGIIFADLRDQEEREHHGILPGCVHTPYGDVDENVHPGGVLRELVTASGAKLIFYCAYGERSAMAVQAARENGLEAWNLKGGIDAWKAAGGEIGKV